MAGLFWLSVRISSTSAMASDCTAFGPWFNMAMIVPMISR
jgi:hypothetical protein